MHHLDASTTASPRPSLLDLFRQSGDDHVGQTLVRLAGLAAAPHAVQTTPAPAEAHGRASGRLVSVLDPEPGSARKDSPR